MRGAKHVLPKRMIESIAHCRYTSSAVQHIDRTIAAAKAEAIANMKESQGLPERWQEERSPLPASAPESDRTAAERWRRRPLLPHRCAAARE